ncbi:MAG: hypothetical protein IJ169_07685 [Paludibacteraceae bacterium]|nr:hypothetical protein [Paludibacteraceae bacterium]
MKSMMFLMEAPKGVCPVFCSSNGCYRQARRLTEELCAVLSVRYGMYPQLCEFVERTATSKMLKQKYYDSPASFLQEVSMFYHVVLNQNSYCQARKRALKSGRKG